MSAVSTPHPWSHAETDLAGPPAPRWPEAGEGWWEPEAGYAGTAGRDSGELPEATETISRAFLTRMFEAYGVETQSPYLLVLDGESAGRAHRLEAAGAETLIGRSERCHVTLRDPSISRRHARLRREPGAVYLESLGGRNGLFLNGEPVEGRMRLRSGDELSVASTRLRFVDPDAGAVAAGQPAAFTVSRPVPTTRTVDVTGVYEQVAAAALTPPPVAAQAQPPAATHEPPAAPAHEPPAAAHERQPVAARAQPGAGEAQAAAGPDAAAEIAQAPASDVDAAEPADAAFDAAFEQAFDEAFDADRDGGRDERRDELDAFEGAGAEPHAGDDDDDEELEEDEAAVDEDRAQARTLLALSLAAAGLLLVLGLELMLLARG